MFPLLAFICYMLFYMLYVFKWVLCFLCWLLYVMCFLYVLWDISYHTPKIDSSNLQLSSLGKTTYRFLRDIWQTDCKPRTASTSFVWLPFSANTIAFTCPPLFELFFRWSYLKTTTICFLNFYCVFLCRLLYIICFFYMLYVF